jgi:cleavage and polyadenylation specificity factor subunit 2
LDTLRKGGNVLIPADCASRVLELAYILEDRWKSFLISYPIVFLNHSANKVIHSAKGMLEWFAETLTKNFANKRIYPFDFGSVKIASSWEDLLKYPNPKLVLATNDSLSSGFSLDVLRDIHMDAKNLIILPGKGQEGSLARQLYDGVMKSETPTEIVTLNETYSCELQRRIPLSGTELDQWVAERNEKNEHDKKQADLMAKNKSIMEADLSDDDESETIPMGKSSGTLRVVNQGHQVKFVGFDAFVANQPLARFPFVEHRRLYDEYGEVIKAEQFMTEVDKIEKEREKAARRKQEAEEHRRQEGNGDDITLEQEEIPSRYAVERWSWEIKCRAKIVDFEGISDLDSLSRIIPLMHARNTVLTGGSKEDTEALQNALREAESESDQEETSPMEISPDDSTGEDSTSTPIRPDQSNSRILCPNVGEAVDLSSAKNVLQIKLTDALYTGISMHKYGDYEVGLISGQVKISEESSLPALDVMDVHVAMRPPSVVIGSVRLSNFKSLLEQQGFQTEFVRGMLLVNGKVGVCKV